MTRLARYMQNMRYLRSTFKTSESYKKARELNGSAYSYSQSLQMNLDVKLYHYESSSSRSCDHVRTSDLQDRKRKKNDACSDQHQGLLEFPPGPHGGRAFPGLFFLTRLSPQALTVQISNCQRKVTSSSEIEASTTVQIRVKDNGTLCFVHHFPALFSQKKRRFS